MRTRTLLASTLAIAGLALAIAGPASAVPPRGKLKPTQQKAFKKQKAAIKKTERAAIRQVKAWTPAVKRSQRRLAETTAARDRSRDRLAQKRETLEYAKNTGRILGQSTPQQVAKLQRDYDKALHAHVNGPRRADLAAQAQHERAMQSLQSARSTRDAAREALVVRKDVKNRVRATNLEMAQQAKAAKHARRGRPNPMTAATTAAPAIAKVAPGTAGGGPALIYGRLPNAGGAQAAAASGGLGRGNVQGRLREQMVGQGVMKPLINYGQLPPQAVPIYDKVPPHIFPLPSAPAGGGSR